MILKHLFDALIAVTSTWSGLRPRLDLGAPELAEPEPGPGAVPPPTGRVLNVTFHGIGTPCRQLDPGEENTWITVEQYERVLDAVADRRDVRIFFDDGNTSDVDVALPRLLERGLVAEFHLLAGRIGEVGRVDRGDIAELVAAGMAIGSHGWAHRDWRRLTPDEVRAEFFEAPRVLSRISGRRVTRVAVPFGSYDRTVLGHLRAAGMERVFTSDGGPAEPAHWLQQRTSIRAEHTADAVERLLSPTPPASARTRRALAGFVKRNRR